MVATEFLERCGDPAEESHDLMPADPDRSIEPVPWGTVGVLVLGTVISLLDATIVNVALPPLARDLHTDLSTIQWVVTGYLLAIAVIIPITGWLARYIGAKNVYLAGVGLFALGSLLCGLSTSAPELIGFRILQGLGGGIIGPVGQLILVRLAGPKNLARVMSAVGVPTIVGPLLGPAVGGLLLEYVGWRSIFFINLPIAAIAIGFGMRRLPNPRPEGDERLDPIGLVLIASGLAGITYGVSETSAHGATALAALVAGVGGVLFVTLFVLRSLRMSNPLLDVRLFGNRVFSAAALSASALSAMLTANAVLTPLYFETLRGAGPFAAGLLAGPRAVGTIIGTWFGGRAATVLGTGRIVLIGTTGVAVATVPFAFVGGHTSYVVLCILMVAQGLSSGIAFIPAQTAAYQTLSAHQLSHATPQMNIVMRISASIGTAIVVAVLTVSLSGAHSATGRSRAFDIAFACLLGFVLLALAAALVLIQQERGHRLTRALSRAEAAEVSVVPPA